MKKWFLIILTSVILGLSANAYAAVELNTATQEELETLDGIGPVKAQAIIDYREKHLGFRTIEELDKVEGIGPQTINKIRKDISIWEPY
jgi:competence protein ComEA